MCTALLPLGVNPIAVNKYINMNISTWMSDCQPRVRGPHLGRRNAVCSPRDFSNTINLRFMIFIVDRVA